MTITVRTSKLTEAQRDAEAVYEAAVNVLRGKGFPHARFVPIVATKPDDRVGYISLEKD